MSGLQRSSYSLGNYQFYQRCIQHLKNLNVASSDPVLYESVRFLYKQKSYVRKIKVTGTEDVGTYFRPEQRKKIGLTEEYRRERVLSTQIKEQADLSGLEVLFEKRHWLYTNVNIADGMLAVGKTAEIEGPDSLQKASQLMGDLCRKFTIHSLERMREPALISSLRGIFLIGFQETKLGRNILEVLLNQVEKKIHLFTPPGLAEIAQVMADANFRHEGIIEKIIEHGSWRAEEFTPDSSAKLFCHMTRIEATNYQLYNKIANAQINHLSQFNATNLAHLVWGVGECGIYKQALMEKVSRYMKKCGMTTFAMTPQAALYILRGLACLNFSDEIALKYICNYLNKNAPQDISLCVGVMNAWATLGQPVDKLTGILQGFNDAFNNQGMSGFNEESLSELYNAILLFRSKGQKMGLGEEINKAAYEAWQKQVQLAEIDEDEKLIINEVCQLLDKQGIKYQPNYIDRNTPIPIDIVIKEKGSKKAINIAGSNQYSCTKPHRPSGGLVSTQWVYEKQGWDVKIIPFYEWEQQKTDDMKMTYLKQIIQV